MNWAGITGKLKNSGKAKAATGLYGKIAWFAAYGAAARTKLVDLASDLAVDFVGDARLISELSAYKHYADVQADAVVCTLAALTSGDIGTLIDTARASAAEGFEMIVIDQPVDLAFLNALSAELATRATNKQYYRAICRWRKALVLDLSNKVVVDKTGGKVGIPAVAHGQEVGDEVLIYGSTNYDGVHILDASTTADEMVFTAVYVAETFSASVMLEETPESYLADFVEKTAGFADPRVHLLVPTTVDTQLGSLAGCATACESVADEPGAVELFPLSNAVTFSDSAWVHNKTAVLKGLVAGRGIVMRLHEEDLTHLFINLSASMHGPKDDQRSLPLGRLADKILRYASADTFASVNSRKYPPNEVGEKAMAQMAITHKQMFKDTDGVGQMSAVVKWNAVVSGWDLLVEAEAPAYGTTLSITTTLIPN